MGNVSPSSPRNKRVQVISRKVYVTTPPSSSKDEPTIRDDEDPDLEIYFHRFRIKTCGINATIQSPQGRLPCIYADWTASGRCYSVIESKLQSELSQYVANTHTETSALGHLMTSAYKLARKTIRNHVNASPDDVLVAVGSGMTGALSKLQSILGMRIPERLRERMDYSDDDKPIIFITHYEHHSNQISWENCYADVVIVPPGNDGEVKPANFEASFKRYSKRRQKIAAISACSNVTGIRTPIHEIAKVAHQYDGLCFVDFATSFGYVNVDMHPTDGNNHEADLDAIYFSPHKLLGGPGSCGILVFHRKLYKLEKPDICGGGTVNWTNPWGEQGFVENIEEREDAGTPPFLQVMKVALAIMLKEEMGVENMLRRERCINAIVFKRLANSPNIHILAENQKERLCIFSVYIDGLHYNLLAKLLNDYYGIQCRGGCNCAGTYGHILFGINKDKSKLITDQIDRGDNSTKPGWCRISFHPIMTNDEVEFICHALKTIARDFPKMSPQYRYDSGSNQYSSTNADEQWSTRILSSIFTLH